MPKISASLQSAITVAMRNLDKVKRMPDLNPIIAFSGGKDSIVAAHLARQALGYRVPAIAEVSFCFDMHTRYTRRMATIMDLDCKFSISRDDAWLKANPKVIFANETSVRSWGHDKRHRESIKKAAADGKHGGVIMGRRTQDNSVPSELYQTKNGIWQCHPIREMTTDHVWEYLEVFGLKYSPLYDFPFGQIQGADQWWGTLPHQLVHPTMAGWKKEIITTRESWWEYLVNFHPVMAKWKPWYDLADGDLMPYEACWDLVLAMDPSLGRYRSLVATAIEARHDAAPRRAAATA